MNDKIGVVSFVELSRRVLCSYWTLKLNVGLSYIAQVYMLVLYSRVINCILRCATTFRLYSLIHAIGVPVLHG